MVTVATKQVRVHNHKMLHLYRHNKYPCLRQMRVKYQQISAA